MIESYPLPHIFKYFYRFILDIVLIITSGKIFNLLKIIIIILKILNLNKNKMILIRKLIHDKSLVFICFILRYHEAQKSVMFFKQELKLFQDMQIFTEIYIKKKSEKNTPADVCGNYQCNRNCNCEIQRFQNNHIIY